MIFKLDWEKTDVTHQLPNAIVEKMAYRAYPNKTLQSYSLIAGGCANLNFKIQFENEPNPFILRVYLRDKESAYKEQSLYKLLKATIPVPQIYFIGEVGNYQFAIIEFMPGITLRDFLIEYKSYDIMHQVGLTLAKIASISIPKVKNLDILNFAKDCVDKLSAKLSQTSITKIHHYLDKYADLLILKDDNNLVHGDFDPANILVNNVGESWRISAILDWEFSFAGSYPFLMSPICFDMSINYHKNLRTIFCKV